MTTPPVGANMAFRKQAFDKFGGFRTDLGRIGEQMLSNEDIEFGRRLMNAGQRLRYEPSALVYHPVDEARVCKDYFLRWWFNKGRSDVREFGLQPNVKNVLGIPLRMFRDAAVEIVRWFIAGDPSRRFICRLKVWAYAGQAIESFYQIRPARQKEQGRDSNTRPATNGTGTA